MFPPRLLWHTVVAAVLFLGGVGAPLLLLCSEVWGQGARTARVVGVALLALSAAALVGAGVSRGFNRHSCSEFRWRGILAATWLLNPVVIVLFAAVTGLHFLAWWSSLPLAISLISFSGKLRFFNSDPQWSTMPCRCGTAAGWLCNRAIAIGFPMLLVSFQVALYQPSAALMPAGPIIGFFVCGGCVLIAVKFCAMCVCLAPGPDGRQRVPQALILAVLLSADWMTSVRMMVPETMSDRFTQEYLLVHLLVVGLLQLRAALTRLQLRLRWQRALLQWRSSRAVRRRAADGGAEHDPELGAELNMAGYESSNSDDDQGPGSLPDGFHDSLITLLGVPPRTSGRVPRQWLLETRLAVVRGLAQGGDKVAVQGSADGVPALAVAPPEGAAPVAAERGHSSVRVLQSLAAAAAGAAGAAASGGAAVAAAAAREPPSAASSGGAAAAAAAQQQPLELAADQRVCLVCLEDIKQGDLVRAMPKCSHVYHAACLERWAREKREGTRCPSCRRPALSRRPSGGATSVHSLPRPESAREARRAARNRDR